MPAPPSPARWSGLGAALGLSLAPLVALGFTRFAYALLLPPMQQEFSWSFTAAGALNTSNAIGYLLGALLAATLATRWGRLRVFSLAMLASALALMATAWPSDFAALLALRFAGGLATAVAFVLGSSFAASAMPGRAGTALAIYFAGSGLGIVLAGTLIPWVNASGAALDWRLAWLLMGLVSLLATALARRAARSALGQGGARAAGHAPPVWRVLGPSLLANLFFGAGYVGYMTFMIALLQRLGLGSGLSMAFFALIGGASVLASLFWGRALARLPLGRGMSLVCVMVAIGTVPALLWPEPWAVIASALIFGASFMAGPAAVSLVAQRLLPLSALTRGLALLTASFSLGQSIGPVLAGAISDLTGSLVAGLWLGPALLLIGAALSWRQRAGAEEV